MKDNNLKKYIDDFFDELVLYDDYYNNHYYKDLLKTSIDVFLDNESSYTAYEVYRTFFMIYQITSDDKSEKSDETSIVYQPNTLLNLVKIMKKYEESTGDLIERQRDHFIHSVNVFILGLAIYSQNGNYREAFMNYVVEGPYEKYYMIDEEFSHEEFLYRWGIASLFHDIGYPVEIIGKQLKKFITDGVKSISSSYGADTAIDFKDFNEFNTIVKLDPNFADEYTEVYNDAKFLNLFKPTDIMAHKISCDFEGINVNDVIKHLDAFVDIMGEMGFIDHGFFSAILVLNSYGDLIQKYSKYHGFFFYPIVDSATAILLHNYYKNVLQKDPFCLTQMNPADSPLAYLLILCDELQEWNRRPFGIKDKQKSHVNDLLIKIDDVSMNVNYVVKTGAMGLGFSKDKVDLLNDLLSIGDVFENGLSIRTDIKQDNVMKEMVYAEAQTPDILLRNIETLAILIHENYVKTTRELYDQKVTNGEEIDEEFMKTYNGLCSFDELIPQLKIANIRQARSIPVKLGMIGCELAGKNDSRPAILEFSPEEVLDLAIFEHDEWCREKEGTGWTYGPKKDVDKLISPYLVPWDELTPEVQQYDIDPVKNIPSLMDAIGLKVVRTKIRLLTFAMHDFYSLENEVESFDELPEYIKYSNYKQAVLLVDMLTELGYDVVDKHHDGEAVDHLTEEEVEYLAIREHNSWYRLKVNVGWTYGPEKDAEAKINPNLKLWDELDNDELKDANRRTFSSLPQLCDSVDLKIVKQN